MSPPPTQLLPPKQDVATLLLQGTSLFIHLDPRKTEVLVPLWFKKQPQLVLQVGLNMAIPIPDLRVDDGGVSATLSFSRTPFWCHIPWSAIYALVGEDGRGMIWPDEVPSEVAAQMQMHPAASPPREPKLRAVPAEEQPSAPTPKKTAKKASAKPATAKKKVAAKKADQPRKPAAAAKPKKKLTAAPRLAPPPAPRVDSAPKPKRDLPPYLRVIK